MKQLGGPSSAELVAQAFTGGRLVKDFNHLGASVLARDPAVQGGRRVVFLSSYDDAAATETATLAETLGFAPIKLGGLSEGGLLVQGRGETWGQLIFKDLVKFDLSQSLTRSDARKRRDAMRTGRNVQPAEAFFAAMDRYDCEDLLTLAFTLAISATGTRKSSG